MAPYPEEVDVFSGPHSRMKELVDVYSERLTCTDFADYIALESLLHDLHHTFCEFKSHEHIENKYIMRKLKKRLKSLSIHDAAVCNCHSDNRLSDMLALFEDGYSCTSKPESERINFGIKLQNALEEFTGVFLPHMKEEEEVFQPMLMKYFEYEELKCLKERVIEEHNKWRTFDLENEKVALEEAASDLKQDIDVNLKDEKELQLPPEVMSHIFSFLSPRDILRCSEVCHSWYELSRNPVLWKELYPCYWAHGIWEYYDTDYEDMMERLYPNCQFPPESYHDEDADVDESGGNEDGLRAPDSSEGRRIMNQEVATLNSMVKHLLPRIGKGVQKIILSSCRGLTSSLLRAILVLCPNVVHLDISYTAIMDSAFKGLRDYSSGVNIQYLDLSGCKGITDLGLFRLADCMAVLPPLLPDGSNELREVYLEDCGRSPEFCMCSGDCKNGNCFCEIEDSGYLLQRNDSNLCANCTVERFCTSVCVWKKNGFMCHLARSVQQCPFVNACKYSNVFDISMAASNILRTTTTFLRDTSSSSSTVSSNCSKTNANGRESGSLRYLNLSGCNEITDEGLRCLIEAGLFNQLEYLDVSGCWHLTGPGLCAAINLAPLLQPENIYYCNKIEDGPYPDTANGCQNLENEFRACCCNRMS